MSLTGDNIVKLTDRQLEILKYLAKGHTNIEISRIAKVSGSTVKAHLATIYEKLEVTNRTEAALYYKKNQTERIVNSKPILILELFSHHETESGNTIDNGKHDHFALNLQTKLMMLLSNRKIFSIIKATNFKTESMGLSRGYLMSGAIYKQADSVNISIYIENYPRGIHIWSHTFYESDSEWYLNINGIANKIVASLMYHLIAKESSTLMELKPKEKNIFQNILIGFHLLTLATSESIIAAQKIFDTIIAATPSNITALYGKCVTAYLTIITDLSKNPSVDYMIVKNCCMNISAISKNCSETCYMRGLLSLLDQDRKGAIVLFENALRLDSSLQEIHLMLAQLYTAAGDYQHGSRYLDQAIALCPDYQYKGNNLVAISIIYFCLGQYDNTIKMLEESSYLQEGNVISILLYSCSLYYAGYSQKACHISKNMTVDKTYINRILALADEEIRNRIFTAFTEIGISCK